MAEKKRNEAPPIAAQAVPLRIDQIGMLMAQRNAAVADAIRVREESTLGPLRRMLAVKEAELAKHLRDVFDINAAEWELDLESGELRKRSP